MKNHSHIQNSEMLAVKLRILLLEIILVLGTKDYVRKNDFSKVIIGLSGGIDSSLTAAIAVDALGAKNVVGITMPSKFNSPETVKDAQMLADNLDIEFYSIPIESVLDKFNTSVISSMERFSK